jgi:hypothetical protein
VTAVAAPRIHENNASRSEIDDAGCARGRLRELQRVGRAAQQQILRAGVVARRAVLADGSERERAIASKFQNTARN